MKPADRDDATTQVDTAVSARAETKKRNGGFAIIELLIIIGVVGTLAAVSVCALVREYRDQRVVAEQAATLIVDRWGSARNHELNVVCIDGFEYYFASIVSEGKRSDKSRAVLAPKFDKETMLPKRCTAEREKSK